MSRVTPSRATPSRATPTRETDKFAAATLVLRLRIDDWSLKVSEGWPDDSASDIAGDAWAGTLPLRKGYAAARPTPDLRPGVPVPASVRALLD